MMLNKIKVSKTIKLFYGKERKKFFFIFLLILISSLLDIIGVASILPFMSLIGNPALISENTYLEIVYKNLQGLLIINENQFITILGIISILFLIFSNVFKSISFFVINKYIELRKVALSSELLMKYFSLDYESICGLDGSSVEKKILADVEVVGNNILRPMFYLFSNIVIILLLILLLLFISLKTTLITCFIFISIYIFILIIIKPKTKQMGLINTTSNTERFSVLSNSIKGIKITKFLSAERFFLNAFNHSCNKFAVSTSTHLTLCNVPKYLIETIVFVSLFIFVIILNLKTDDNNMINNYLGEISIFGFAAYRLQPSLQSLFLQLNSFNYGMPFLDSISSLYSLQSNASRQDENTLKLKNTLTLDDICFNYKNNNVKIFDKINIKFFKNNFYGIIGNSGSGKTTLVDIILGLLTPSAGRIFLDDVIISRHNVNKYRTLFGYVPQETFLYNKSIYENIAFGEEPSQICKERVIESSKIANIHDFIVDKLPNKFYTSVGDNGINLSGGQRQRIGIARALYRNPDIIVFDESTSALDSETENNLLEEVLKLSKLKTVIFITHNKSLLSNCNYIINLNSYPLSIIENNS